MIRRTRNRCSSISLRCCARWSHPPTPPPPGPGQERAAGEDITQPAGPPVRQRCCRRCVSGNGPAGMSLVRIASVLQPGPAAGRPGGRAGHADRRRRPAVRHVPARGAAEPGRSHPDRGRSAGGVGAPAVFRARLLEPAAAGPARRAAPGRHRAAVRPCHQRRPARRRTALGSRAAHPAARRTDPRRPEPARHPGGSQRAARRGTAPDRPPGGHRRPRANWPIWPASRCSSHPSPAWPPRSPARCPSTACSSPRLPPPSPASKSPTTGRARSTESRTPQPPGRVAEQPVDPAGRPGPAGGRAGRDRGSGRHPPGAGRGPPGRVPARPGHVAEQPVDPAGRPGPAGGRAGGEPGSRQLRRELAAARPDAFRPDLASR